MIQELFLYDREKGLFKVILDKSSVIEGRYHVSPNNGNDLNTNNLETYINDPKTGLSDAGQKYPIAVCMTPKSRYVKLNGAPWEEFIFNIFFVCRSNATGKNQIKKPNKDTNTSTHYAWYDWQDMKKCAFDFIEVLGLQLKKPIAIDSVEVPLKSVLQMDKGNVVYTRLTKFNSDKLSGVAISFAMYLSAHQCTLLDYEMEDVDAIVLPVTDIHPLDQ